MKTLGTALAALTLAFSGSAMADHDGHRHHGHYGGHHHPKHGTHWKQGDFHSLHHHFGPTVHYGYRPSPVHAPYPYYGYAPPPRSHHRDGVTIILPPVRIGF